MQKRDTVSISGLRRSPGVGNGNLFKYSCLENSKDKGSWWATVHVVAKSWTWACVCVCTQSHTHTHTHTHTQMSERKKVKSLGHVWLVATPWTVFYQAPQSKEFPRQEYWSEQPFPSPGYFPESNPRLCITGRHFIAWATRKARVDIDAWGKGENEHRRQLEHIGKKNYLRKYGVISDK